MPLDRQALLSELKRLRRDEGRTLVKLLASPAVREALGDPPESHLQEQFDAAVSALGSDLRSLALKNAYAIGLSEPANLTTRRETFGAQPGVDRGPETISNWENEKLEEFAAQLLSGRTRRYDDHLLVAVAVAAGRITVVVEGSNDPGGMSRQLYNPVPEPFIPAFIYRMPPYLSPSRLTLCALFLDDPPAAAWAAAASDLLAVVCGDGRQALSLVPGGIPGVAGAAHAAVHWDKPAPDVYFAIRWQVRGGDAPGQPVGAQR